MAEALGVRFAIDVDKRIAGGAEVGAHKTSMLQDLERGRPMEIDALLGSVVELAEMVEAAGADLPHRAGAAADAGRGWRAATDRTARMASRRGAGRYVPRVPKGPHGVDAGGTASLVPGCGNRGRPCAPPRTMETSRMSKAFLPLAGLLYASFSRWAPAGRSRRSSGQPAGRCDSAPATRCAAPRPIPRSSSPRRSNSPAARPMRPARAVAQMEYLAVEMPNNPRFTGDLPHHRQPARRGAARMARRPRHPGGAAAAGGDRIALRRLPGAAGGAEGRRGGGAAGRVFPQGGQTALLRLASLPGLPLTNAAAVAAAGHAAAQRKPSAAASDAARRPAAARAGRRLRRDAAGAARRPRRGARAGQRRRRARRDRGHGPGLRRPGAAAWPAGRPRRRRPRRSWNTSPPRSGRATRATPRSRTASGGSWCWRAGAARRPRHRPEAAPPDGGGAGAAGRGHGAAGGRSAAGGAGPAGADLPPGRRALSVGAARRARPAAAGRHRQRMLAARRWPGWTPRAAGSAARRGCTGGSTITTFGLGGQPGALRRRLSAAPARSVASPITFT